MPRGKPKMTVEAIAKKLSAQDTESLRKDIERMENQLKPSNPDAQDFYNPGVQDKGAIERQIEHKKMVLDHDEDLRARGGEKDRLFNRQKEIEEVLRKRKPSHKEMWAKDPSEFSRAVQHNVTYQEKYQPLEHELQNIRVRLDPDDPNAHSLEYLRADR